jgi:DNA-binding SARP family transcriptional activator/TolB-like protein/Tfp pilus assembly protein PilF
MTLSISMLGPLMIESEGGRLGKVPKKARALLAFLAAQGGQAASRERLADLLWPYQGSEQARHSLRNCLLELRKALGPAAVHLVTDFAHCQLQAEAVDLARFEQLARASQRADLEAAAGLYRGELLADFDINSEPFQEWLTAERDRTLALICQVLHRLTALQDAAGEPDAAIASGRRLVGLDPLSEFGQRALMRAYARAGRRGEALRQYKTCAETLKRELGVAPDAETQALATQIAQAGRPPEAPLYDQQRHAAAPAMPHRRLEHRSPPPIPAAGSGTTKPKWPCLLPTITVAVAPVRNLTGDPDQQRLVDAINEDLVTDLINHGRRLSLKPVIDQTPGVVRPVGGENGERAYDYFVSGSAQRSGPGKLRLNMRITDASTAEYLWAGRHEFHPEELAPVQTRITRRVSRELHVLLLQAASRRAFFVPGVEHGVAECLSQASNALRRGYARAELSAEAQRWYLTALASEPRNVDALTGLALTCQHLVSNPWWGESQSVAAAAELGREAAAIALSIAPGRADARCVQGMLFSAAGQLEDAAGAFKHAVTADPGLGIAQGFAGYNAAFLGRSDETLPVIERALRSDQTEYRHGICLFFGGFGELLLGRIAAAIALLQRSLEHNPVHGSAQLFLTAALSLAGRRNEAAMAADKFRAQYPEYRANAFERLWVSRSGCPAYRTQLQPLFDEIRAVGLAN